MYTWFEKCFGSSCEAIAVLHPPTEEARLRRDANPEHPNFPLLVLLTWLQELELYLCICTNLLQPDITMWHIRQWIYLTGQGWSEFVINIVICNTPRTRTVRRVGWSFFKGKFKTFKKVSCAVKHDIKKWMNWHLRFVFFGGWSW